MILNSSIKTAIMQNFKSLEKDYSREEVIATEILFYKFILSFMKSNPDQKNNINNLITSYANEYKMKFINLKNKATSYKQIISFLENIEANNLLNINEKDIDKIYKFYVNGSLIIPFDSEYFDENMYNVQNLLKNEHEYLKNIHYSIMCPIYKHYHEIYKINNSNFHIASADSVPGNAGKIILFSIDNISPIIIYSDILNHKIPIYDIKCEIQYPYIKLTIF